MSKRSRRTSGGDVVRAVTGVVLILIGLIIWGQNSGDLGAVLNGGRGPLTAGFLVVVCIVGGIGLVLVGILWRGRDRS